MFGLLVVVRQSKAVVLNLSNAVTWQYSSSCCGDPKPKYNFGGYFKTVILLQL